MAGVTCDQVVEVMGYHDRATAYWAVQSYFGTVPPPDPAMASIGRLRLQPCPTGTAPLCETYQGRMKAWTVASVWGCPL